MLYFEYDSTEQMSYICTTYTDNEQTNRNKAHYTLIDKISKRAFKRGIDLHIVFATFTLSGNVGRQFWMKWYTYCCSYLLNGTKI